MKCCTLIPVFLSLFAVDLVQSHVSLTFPPSRQFPIDFLNTFWTKQPCGMPKGRVQTSLLAGHGFNITWHLGYAHQGGYRLELLDRNENKLMDLTPTNDNEFYQGLTTAQSHYIDLPANSSCFGCTIRLLREVPEFAPGFQFISCADVDIMSKHHYVENCNGHGYVIGGRCTCYARYWGDRCQYQDECDTDIDCNQGRCVHLGGSALPRKQCFCPSSHYGPRCGLQNPSSMPSQNNLNLKKHVRVPLDERITMYFKILLGSSQSQDEIEFVMQINGTSYGGLGWRPANIGPVCKSWPFFANALQVNGGSNRRGKRSPTSTFTITKAIDESDIFPPSSQTHTHSRSQNYFSSATSPLTHVIQRQQSIVRSSSSPSNQIYQSFDNHKPTVQQNRYSSTSNNIQVVQLQSSQRSRIPNVQVQTIEYTHTPIATESRTPQVQALPLPRGQTLSQQPRPQPRSRPQPPPQPQLPPQFATPPSNHPSSEWAAKDPFTPMDCSDIITGVARGNYHRIRDTYSRGRHTPLPDSIWGGRDDLTGAVGWETHGITTLAFRRRMDASDGPDHSIRGEMQVIWARGQEPGEIVPNPHHQLVPGHPTVSNFYTRDELKYHGLGSQRGFLFIDFDAVRDEYVSGRFSQ